MRTREIWITVLSLLFFPMSAETQGGGIESSVSVRKIVMELDGHEVFLPAKQARPGDMLEYTITFHNTAEFEFSGVEAIFPIPSGTTYIKGSAYPATARIDAKTVTWIIETFAPGAKVMFKARVRMKK